MARGDDREREDDGPPGAVDAPFNGHQRRRANDHTGNDDDRDQEREPEPLENLGHFLEEVGALDFLLCCRPSHVVREEMGKDCLADWNRQTTEEEEADGYV